MTHLHERAGYKQIHTAKVGLGFFAKLLPICGLEKSGSLVLFHEKGKVMETTLKTFKNTDKIKSMFEICCEKLSKNTKKASL